MKIVMTGATGFIGRRLKLQLDVEGFDVSTLSGRELAEGRLDPKALDGVDGVVHLAGENLADGRWTFRKKRRIRDSRVVSTKLLAEALAALKRPHLVFVSASAVGLYGGRGDEKLDESSGPGEGFLAQVCRDWEAAAEPARQAGVRVVHPRFGVVLGMGGALAKMLPPFRLGLGGPIGSGEQFLSWVQLEDAVAAVRTVLDRPNWTGPINVVSPNPVRQKEFARTLGRVLGRPAVAPLPALAARIALGEMADEALLASQRVRPAKLAAGGFTFQYPELEGALRRSLA